MTLWMFGWLLPLLTNLLVHSELPVLPCPPVYFFWPRCMGKQRGYAFLGPLQEKRGDWLCCCPPSPLVYVFNPSSHVCIHVMSCTVAAIPDLRVPLCQKKKNPHPDWHGRHWKLIVFLLTGCTHHTLQALHALSTRGTELSHPPPPVHILLGSYMHHTTEQALHVAKCIAALIRITL